MKTTIKILLLAAALVLIACPGGGMDAAAGDGGYYFTYNCEPFVIITQGNMGGFFADTILVSYLSIQGTTRYVKTCDNNFYYILPPDRLIKIKKGAVR